MKMRFRLLASWMTALTLIACLAGWSSVGLAHAPLPTKFVRPIGARPAPAPSWSYDFARTPESALNALNGGVSKQTIRGPEISATVKDGRPVFHIFYQPYYNAQATWKWNLKLFTKLNEVLDFLSYKNAYKSEPSHGQMKVVMVTVGGKNLFYIFYNNNTDSGSFAKDEWVGFMATAPDNVLAGINQSSVGNDGVPASDVQVSAADNGFYYFFDNHRLKGSSKWGWARCETVEGALNFLNGKPPYTNKTVQWVSIAAAQEPNQIVFYVFYHK